MALAVRASPDVLAFDSRLRRLCVS